MCRVDIVVSVKVGLTYSSRYISIKYVQIFISDYYERVLFTRPDVKTPPVKVSFLYNEISYLGREFAQLFGICILDFRLELHSSK